MSKPQRDFLQSVKIALAYVGTVIGAGFASGQEVLRFFTMYGSASMFSILLSTLLFIYIGKRILLLGSRIGALSFWGIIRSVFGVFSPLVNCYLLVALISIVSAMLAGAGILFHEHLGVHFWWGAVFTALIAFVSILYGVRGILSVNSMIVPLIILFNIMLLLWCLFNNIKPDAELPQIYASPFQLIASGISYASLNIMLSVGVLAAMGSEVKSIKSLALGGILGGIILGALLFANNYCLIVNSPAIYDYEIPVLFIVHMINPVFFGFYTVVLWFAIFTTLVGSIFSLTAVASDILNIPVVISSLAVIAVGLFFSSVGFSRLVTWIYPILGLVGAFLILALIFRKIK